MTVPVGKDSTLIYFYFPAKLRVLQVELPGLRWDKDVLWRGQIKFCCDKVVQPRTFCTLF